jgi:hypothetical protein
VSTRTDRIGTPLKVASDVRDETVSHCCARATDALRTTPETAAATVRWFTPTRLVVGPEPAMNFGSGIGSG